MSVVLPTPLGPTMPIRSSGGHDEIDGGVEHGRARRRRHLQAAKLEDGLALLRAPTPSRARPRRGAPRSPIRCASSSWARWMRAFCLVLRALGPRESHSRSRRRMFWRFCSTRSSWAMSSALLARGSRRSRRDTTRAARARSRRCAARSRRGSSGRGSRARSRRGSPSPGTPRATRPCRRRGGWSARRGWRRPGWRRGAAPARCAAARRRSARRTAGRRRARRAGRGSRAPRARAPSRRAA